MRNRMLKIAITGLPAVGKSTASSVLVNLLSSRGLNAKVIKLAAPLYDIQASFYHRLGSPLKPHQQDGQLLNFLGGHFRKVDSVFLHRDLERRCLYAESSGATVLICDDARPLDLSALKQAQFKIIKIIAPDALRLSRKAARGDKLTGDDSHFTEAATEGELDHIDLIIENNSSLDDYQATLALSLDSLLSSETELERPRSIIERQVVDEMIAKATDLIRSTYAENRHQIAASVLTSDGQIFTGLHIEAMVGRASVCAEAVALGKACEAGAGDIQIVLAVRHPKPSELDSDIKLVPPCGLCRELILDYGAKAKVAIEVNGQLQLIALDSMLPYKYVGTKWLALTR